MQHKDGNKNWFIILDLKKECKDLAEKYALSTEAHNNSSNNIHDYFNIKNEEHFEEVMNQTLKANEKRLLDLALSHHCTGFAWHEFALKINDILDQKDQKIKELEEKLNAK